MIDSDKHNYWSQTRQLMWIVLALWIAGGILIHFFAVPLNQTIFLGFPLGYFLAAKGTLVFFAMLVFWFCQRQDNIDRAFGVSEDS